MPYISQEKRKILDPGINTIHQLLVGLEKDDPLNSTEGNLNYTITRLLHMVYGQHDSTRYNNINDAIGVLECIKQEYYRCVAAPYENQKMYDNGAVLRFQTEPETVGSITVEPPH